MSPVFGGVVGIPSLRGNTLNAEQPEWGDEGDSCLCWVGYAFWTLGVALWSKGWRSTQAQRGHLQFRGVCGRHV